MDQEQEEQNRKIQEFLGREFNWKFTAYECNFLVQLLAYVVQENPAIVADAKGGRERLDYQSIRSVVLLNDKLSGQLQDRASEASILIDQMKSPSERIQ